MENRKKQKEIDGVKQQLATLLSQPLLHKGTHARIADRTLKCLSNLVVFFCRRIHDLLHPVTVLRSQHALREGAHRGKRSSRTEEEGQVTQERPQMRERGYVQGTTNNRIDSKGRECKGIEEHEHPCSKGREPLARFAVVSSVILCKCPSPTTQVLSRSGRAGRADTRRTTVTRGRVLWNIPAFRCPSLFSSPIN